MKKSKTPENNRPSPAEALEESEGKFREIFNKVNDAIHLHEIEPDGSPGRFIDVNEVACQMLQYSRDEMLQHTPLNFATEYHSRPLEKIVEELKTAGHAVFETGHRRKDGTIVQVEINAHVIQFGRKRRVLSVVRDITERKQVEEELRQSEERLNLAIDGANLGLWDMNLLTGGMVHNRRWAEMLGFSIDELEKPSVWWGERIHPDDYQNVLNLSNLHRAGKVPFFDAVYRMKHKDGSWRWVHSQGKVVSRDTDGRPLRMIGINQDITEQKRAGETE
ncbi:MAG: PAS domain S-box protein, partial [Methanoregula sp.]|nr:PAS domain S-box protein [Methanoregula sp.]